MPVRAALDIRLSPGTLRVEGNGARHWELAPCEVCGSLNADIIIEWAAYVYIYICYYIIYYIYSSLWFSVIVVYPSQLLKLSVLSELEDDYDMIDYCSAS